MAKTVSGTVACSVCSILKNETSAGIQLATNNTQKAKQWLDRLSSGGVKIHSLPVKLNNVFFVTNSFFAPSCEWHSVLFFGCSFYRSFIL